MHKIPLIKRQISFVLLKIQLQHVILQKTLKICIYMMNKTKLILNSIPHTQPLLMVCFQPSNSFMFMTVDDLSEFFCWYTRIPTTLVYKHYIIMSLLYLSLSIMHLTLNIHMPNYAQAQMSNREFYLKDCQRTQSLIVHVPQISSSEIISLSVFHTWI